MKPYTKSQEATWMPDLAHLSQIAAPHPEKDARHRMLREETRKPKSRLRA